MPPCEPGLGGHHLCNGVGWASSHLCQEVVPTPTDLAGSSPTGGGEVYRRVMAAVWRSALPLLLVAALIAFEEWVSVPSCEIAGGGGVGVEERPEDLKVMMVADLLLLGADGGFTNFYFRHAFATKFFRKSFEKLKPDMLVVLGDVSERGFEFTNSKWLSLLQQFQRMLGPFLGLPLHIVLGDRDIGFCTNINEESVSHIASNLPRLDSSGCGVFEISNITFVSLNAVALLCGNNGLRFNVEKVIENESLDLHNSAKGKKEAAENQQLSSFSDFLWRDNGASAGSGPVLLLHFPLHRMTKTNCDSVVFKRKVWHNIPMIHKSSSQMDRRIASAGPYELMHTLPPNATDYILQALKPRIVFSAHTHQFCDHIHIDGTREVTVPAMSWMARDDPGFIIVTFRQEKVVTVSHCSLARESHVLMVYASILVLLTTTMLVTYSSYLTKLFVS